MPVLGYPLAICLESSSRFDCLVRRRTLVQAFHTVRVAACTVLIEFVATALDPDGFSAPGCPFDGHSASHTEITKIISFHGMPSDSGAVQRSLNEVPFAALSLDPALAAQEELCMSHSVVPFDLAPFLPFNDKLYRVIAQIGMNGFHV